MPDRLTKLENLLINRVAFVGQGDNPEANLLLWKSDPSDEWAALVLKKTFTKDRRIELAKSGAAIAVKNDDGDIVDGRYPIEDEADLKNAMQAIGRVAEGDRAEVVRHIRKRAKALGKTDLLSDTFKEGSVDDITKEPRLTPKKQGVLRRIREEIGSLLGETGDKEGGSMSDKDTEKEQFELPDDTPEAVQKHVESLTEKVEAADAKIAELEKAAKAADAPKDDEDQDPIAKALADPEVPESVKAVLKAEHDRATAAEASAKESADKVEKAERDRLDAEEIEKVKSLKYLAIEADKFGPAMRKFAAADPEAAEQIEQVLRATDARAREAFLEIGKAGGEDENSAAGKLDKMAKEYADSEKVSYEAAMAAVTETAEGRKLRMESQDEAREGVS